MKYARLAALLLAVLCLLTACSGFVSDDFVSVSEHYNLYAYMDEETEAPTESEPLPTVSNYYELMGLLRNYVNNGITEGQFLMEQYDGDRADELSAAVSAIRTEDPVGAYAIRRMTYRHSAQQAAWIVTVDAVYRHTTEELQAIRSVRGNERAMQAIGEALDQKSPVLTLRISGYTETAFAAWIRRYCLEHPNTMAETPQTEISVYPDSGNVRVVELRFRYASEQSSLRSMQTEDESVLLSAERYAHYATSDAVRLSLLYSYLTSRFSYAENVADGSVYRFLCQGVGNSESCAAVMAYLCKRVGLDCRIVDGTRTVFHLDTAENADVAVEKLAYAWNMVCLDGAWYHLDLNRDALERSADCVLRLDGEMAEYDWDREAYPVCDGAPVEPEP